MSTCYQDFQEVTRLLAIMKGCWKYVSYPNITTNGREWDKTIELERGEMEGFGAEASKKDSHQVGSQIWEQR